MIVQLDTSVLIAALTGRRQAFDDLTGLIEEGHRASVSAIVLYEWLRGPRQTAELEVQEVLFPREAAVRFGAAEAALAARLYRLVKRPRGREVDLAVAACALANDATLWTLNATEFQDVPDLKLW